MYQTLLRVLFCRVELVMTNDLDLKLKLFSGATFKVDNMDIVPYTLKEIIDYGYSRYMQNVQVLSIEKEDLISSIENESNRKALEDQIEEVRAFDFFVKLGGLEMQQLMLMALSMVLRAKDIRILEEKNIVVVDFIHLGIIEEFGDGNYDFNTTKFDEIPDEQIKIIHRENFDEIVNIVKLQNYLSSPEKSEKKESNPADEETRALIEHMEMMKKKVQDKKRKQQKSEGGDIDMYDILDAVSVKSNSINKTNIFDLTIYQVYCEYARLELIDNYDFSIKAMMAGAKIDALKHWSSKLN